MQTIDPDPAKIREFTAILRNGATLSEGSWRASDVLGPQVAMTLETLIAALVDCLGKEMPKWRQRAIAERYGEVLRAIDNDLGTSFASDYRLRGWTSDVQLRLRIIDALGMLAALAGGNARQFACGFWGLFDPADWPGH